ncbi:MAG: TonB family protein [Alphaproteobacteria bacterium]|nr:TonB family protein [Alphaproteobacteria bacterium]
MTNAVPLRTFSWVISAAFWAALVAGAFTMGMKLPAPEFSTGKPESIDVKTELRPPPTTPPETPRTQVRATQEAEAETLIVPFPVAMDPLPPSIAPAALGPPGPVTTPAPVITNPVWLSRPGAREFERFYPPRALERGREGRVTLDCVVGASGAIACTVARETPEGWGFGAAALKIAPSFRLAPRMEDGRATEGGTVRVDLAFTLDG